MSDSAKAKFGAKLASLCALCGLIFAAPAVARADLPAGLQPFDRFARATASACMTAPSALCAQRTFAALDFDGNDKLDLAELERVRGDLQAWAREPAAPLDQTGRTGLSAGLGLIDALGLPSVVRLYDSDNDGALSFAEATQDLRLGDLTVPQSWARGELVNRQSLRQRLGPAGFLLDAIKIW